MKEFSVLIVPSLPHNGISREELRQRFLDAGRKFDMNREVTPYEIKCGVCGGDGRIGLVNCRFCNGEGKAMTRRNPDAKWLNLRPSQKWAEYLQHTFGAKPLAGWDDLFRLKDIFNDPMYMTTLPDCVITPEGEWLNESRPFLQDRWAELKNHYCIVMMGEI